MPAELRPLSSSTPPFPSAARFDPMFNWQKPTELASRIQSVMPPDTTGSFSCLRLDAVNVGVGHGRSRRPPQPQASLAASKGAEQVSLRSLERHFTAEAQSNWRESVKPYAKRAADGKIRRPSDTATDELLPTSPTTNASYRSSTGPR
jgi:conjugal transfer pilus assembly protein TraD